MSVFQAVRAATGGMRSLALTNNASTKAAESVIKRPGSPFMLFKNEKIKVK